MWFANIPSFWKSKTPLFVALGIWLIAFCIWSVVPMPSVSPERLSELTENGRKYFNPDHDLPIYVLSGICAVCLSAVFQLRLFQKSNHSTPCHDTAQFRFVWADLWSFAIVTMLVAVVSPSKLMQRTFSCDGFHHVDYYVMSPLQAYCKSKSLGTDFLTQYGGGWVLVYAALNQFHRIDYLFFFTTFPLFGLAYFLVAYFALRLLTRDCWWSLIGLLVGIALTMYCGNGIPRWVTPNATILRCPLDMVLAILIFQFENRREGFWAVLAGAVAGASLLFGVDTGIYMLSGLIVVSALMVIQSIYRRAFCPLAIQLLLMWISVGAVMLIGLTIVSRGTIMERRFWSGYFEALTIYGGGFSALPLSSLIRQEPLGALMFLIAIVTYTLELSSSIGRAITNRPERGSMTSAFLATVGFGMLMVFVNRSMVYNLYYAILPAVWLTIRYVAGRYPLEGQQESSHQRFRERLAACIAAGTIVALLLNQNFRAYPSVIGETISAIRSYPVPPSVVPKLTEEIREIGKALREENQESQFIIVGEDPTLWLMTLDLPPVGRYCPMVPINRRQCEQFRRDVLNTEARCVVVTRVPHAGSLAGDSNILEQIIEADFKLRESKELYAIYDRRSAIDEPHKLGNSER